MAKYKKYDWSALFKAFEESKLTQTAFCQEHDLNLKYFSQRLKRFKLERQGITQVKVAQPLISGLTIEYGQCRIHCSAQTTVMDIAQLVRALA